MFRYILTSLFFALHILKLQAVGGGGGGVGNDANGRTCGKELSGSKRMENESEKVAKKKCLV